MSYDYSYFENKACKYFPCHEDLSADNCNCLFCYCPLYYLGEQCGGNYTITENGVKSCLHCSYPHRRENYAEINKRLKELRQGEKAKKPSDPV